MANSAVRVSVEGYGLTESIVRQAKEAERYIRPIRLSVDDRASLPLGRISAQAKAFDTSLTAASARVFAFGATVGVFASISRAIDGLITSTIEVDKRLRQINATFGLSTESIKRFGNSLFVVAKDTEQSFGSVADAALELARQGLSAEETLKRLRDAMILTRLSGMDAQDSVSTLTATINGFTNEVLDSSTILNKLVAVDQRFAVSTADLANGLQRVASVAQDANVSFDELLGIITAAQQRTARGGAVIGNAFKTIFTRVNRPEVLDQLREMGIAINDVNGKTLPAIQIMSNLANSYDNLSNAQKSQISQSVAGLYQINILKASLKDLASQNSIAARATEAASLASEDAYRRNELMNKSISAMFNQTAQGFKELAAEIGTSFMDKSWIQELLTSLNTGLNNITKDLKGTDAGKTFAEGLIDGITNVLSGPGLAIGALLFGKVSYQIGQFASEAFKSLLTFNKTQKEQENTQVAINNLLRKATEEENRMFMAAKSVAEQQKIIESIFERIAITSRIAATETAALAQALRASGVVGKVDGGNIVLTRKTKGGALSAANGFVPSIAKEEQSIRQGVGGAQSNARPVVIPNFNFGQGKRGTVVANTNEYVVPNFAGSSGSAIFNQAMVAQYGLPSQAKKITPNGLIPNFAPIINQEQLRSLISSKKFQSVIYKNQAGEIGKLNAAQHHVRRDKLVGAAAPAGYGSWGNFDAETNTIVLHGIKEGESKAGFRRLKLGNILAVHANNQKYDVAANGLIPNFANLRLRESGLAPELGRGYLGTAFRYVKRPDIVTKGYRKGDSDTEIRNEFVSLDKLSKTSRGAIEYVRPFGTLKRSVERGYIGKPFIPNVDNFYSKIRGPFTDYAFAAVTKEARAMANNANIYDLDLHGGNFGFNDRAAQIFNNIGRVVDTRKIDLFEKLFKDTDIRRTFFDKIGKAGAKFSIFDPVIPVKLMADGFIPNSGRRIKSGRNKIKGSQIRYEGTWEDWDNKPEAWTYFGPDLKNERGHHPTGSTVFAETLRNFGIQIPTNKIRGQKFPVRFASDGFIPNFASPLTEAIRRERKAGVSIDKIRIEQSKKLRTSKNPLGLAITNTIDEPHGVEQGIARAKSYGLDPTTHGAANGLIPNFAPPDALTRQQIEELVLEPLRKEFKLSPNLTEEQIIQNLRSRKTFGAGARPVSAKKIKTFIGQQVSMAYAKLLQSYKPETALVGGFEESAREIESMTKEEFRTIGQRMEAETGRKFTRRTAAGFLRKQFKAIPESEINFPVKGTNLEKAEQFQLSDPSKRAQQEAFILKQKLGIFKTQLAINKEASKELGVQTRLADLIEQRAATAKTIEPNLPRSRRSLTREEERIIQSGAGLGSLRQQLIEEEGATYKAWQTGRRTRIGRTTPTEPTFYGPPMPTYAQMMSMGPLNPLRERFEPGYNRPFARGFPLSAEEKIVLPKNEYLTSRGFSLSAEEKIALRGQYIPPSNKSPDQIASEIRRRQALGSISRQGLARGWSLSAEERIALRGQYIPPEGKSAKQMASEVRERQIMESIAKRESIAAGRERALRAKADVRARNIYGLPTGSELTNIDVRTLIERQSEEEYSKLLAGQQFNAGKGRNIRQQRRIADAQKESLRRLQLIDESVYGSSVFSKTGKIEAKTLAALGGSMTEQERTAFTQANRRRLDTRSARITSGAFAASFVAPMVAGFVPEGAGGTGRGMALGATSGGLQLGGTLAGLGSIGGPWGAAIGGGAGLVIGGVIGALSKSKKSLEEFARELEQINDVSSRLDGSFGALLDATSRMADTESASGRARLAKTQQQSLAEIQKLSPNVYKELMAGPLTFENITKAQDRAQSEQLLAQSVKNIESLSAILREGTKPQQQAALRAGSVEFANAISGISGGQDIFKGLVLPQIEEIISNFEYGNEFAGLAGNAIATPNFGNQIEAFSKAIDELTTKAISQNRVDILPALESLKKIGLTRPETIADIVKNIQEAIAGSTKLRETQATREPFIIKSRELRQGWFNEDIKNFARLMGGSDMAKAQKAALDEIRGLGVPTSEAGLSALKALTPEKAIGITVEELQKIFPETPIEKLTEAINKNTMKMAEINYARQVQFESGNARFIGRQGNLGFDAFTTARRGAGRTGIQAANINFDKEENILKRFTDLGLDVTEEANILRSRRATINAPANFEALFKERGSGLAGVNRQMFLGDAKYRQSIMANMNDQQRMNAELVYKYGSQALSSGLLGSNYAITNRSALTGGSIMTENAVRVIPGEMKSTEEVSKWQEMFNAMRSEAEALLEKPIEKVYKVAIDITGAAKEQLTESQIEAIKKSVQEIIAPIAKAVDDLKRNAPPAPPQVRK